MPVGTISFPSSKFPRCGTCLVVENVFVRQSFFLHFSSKQSTSPQVHRVLLELFHVTTKRKGFRVKALPLFSLWSDLGPTPCAVLTNWRRRWGTPPAGDDRRPGLVVQSEQPNKVKRGDRLVPMCRFIGPGPSLPA